ncbi:MAG: EAL domain-containing protein [Clostridia bacterium]
MKKLILSIFTLVLLISVYNFSVQAQTLENPTVIKVGYMLNYGTIKSPVVKGSEGYGYEYLSTIFEYAEDDYEIELVYCEWSNWQEMMENGEIDIIGPMTYYENTMYDYLFPEESFGDNIIFLSALSENDIYYNSYDDIDGSTIAVQTDNPNEYMLYDFLEEHDLEAEVVYFSDNDFESVLENFDYDFIVTSSLQTYSNITPIATLGSTDFYYIVDSDNQWLMDVINEGMAEINNNEFLYQEKLYLEYYDYSIVSSSLPTQEESELILSQDVYSIGVVNLQCPICKINTEGEFEGVVIDAIAYFAEISGINYELVEITDDMTQEEFDSIDFSLLCTDEELRATLTESDNYYTMPYLLVDNSEIEEIENIGILTFYGITEVQLEDHLFGRDIVLYDTVVDMQEDYNNGTLDSMLITTYTLNLIRDNYESLNFISTTVDFDLNFTFIYSENFSSEKISIFNKYISLMDEAILTSSALEHSTPTVESLTAIQYLKQNPVILSSALFILIFAILLSELKRRNELSHFLNYDDLTGLASYHKFLTDTKIILAKEKNKKFCIVSFDIDNFKYVNEFYGYETGSTVLKLIAKNIKDNSTNAKIVSRANNDNFLLLVEKSTLNDQLGLSVETGNGLYDYLSDYIGENYEFSFSIGIYEIENKNLDLSFMIDCANAAKALGKNVANTTVNYFTKEMDRKRISNNDIVSHMINALEQNEFVLYYQPKVDLKNNKIIGAEALVRWIKDGNIIPPVNFIPLFERNGFIEKLDYYVFEKVCEFIDQNSNTARVSVNFSSATIMKGNIKDKILEITQKYNFPYSKIDIEITETAFVNQFDTAIVRLQELRDLGFTISMDDFGVGISSLNRLKNIPLDVLKIDREFIIDSIDNKRGGEIIKNIINMANDLNLSTVAEGIETKEQEEFLKSLGCDVGQGYFFHRPMPQKNYEVLLKNYEGEKQ